MPSHTGRVAFEFYRGFDKPNVRIGTRIDVTALTPALARLKAGSPMPAEAGADSPMPPEAGAGSITLACHFVALSLANKLEPFRDRLQQGRVQVLPAVHGSTTVLPCR